jgi:hypothetical protein
MIVNSIKDYNKLNTMCNTNVGIVAVIPSNSSIHHCVGNISFIYYKFDNGESFILGKRHPDTLHTFNPVYPTNGYVINKKEALHLAEVGHLTDLFSLYYANNMEIPDVNNFLTPWATNILQMFTDLTILEEVVPANNVVPLSLWHKIYDSFADKLFSELPAYNIASKMLNNIISTFAQIEKNGLYVNKEKYSKYFGDKQSLVSNSFVYSSYNIFTQTGRPSNSYKGINFAALNKSDGSREVFESRFGDNGILVQIDFDAYHLRLLANSSGITMPDESLHEVLAKQYYNTETITDEQYEEGKKKTFQLLYGNITPDENFPYLLKSIHKTRNKFWEDYKKYGYIATRYSGRKIVVTEPSINKVFNYYVQSLESEVTYGMLHKLIPMANAEGLKPILYTYDSILFDIQKDEINKLMDIINSVIDSKKYPFSISAGDNYNNLKEI